MSAPKYGDTNQDSQPKLRYRWDYFKHLVWEAICPILTAKIAHTRIPETRHTWHPATTWTVFSSVYRRKSAKKWSPRLQTYTNSNKKSRL